MAVARVLVARGRRAEAERAASAAAALADATDVSTEQAGNRAVLAEAFAAAGKAAEAVNALERAAGLCEAKGVWGAKTLFIPRDHPDLQAEPSADAPHG